VGKKTWLFILPELHMDPEVLRELQDSIKSFNDQLSSFGSTMAGMVNAVNQQAGAVRDNTAAEKKNSDAINKGAGSVDPLAKANSQAAEAVKEANANFAQAARTSVGALKDFSSAVLSAESGMAKYGKSAEGMGMAAFQVGKNFGLLGAALGLGLGAFGALASSIFKLDDNIVNVRDSFTSVAGVLPATTTEIGNLAKQARFSLDDMEKLSKQVNGLGQNLLGMGGYAGEGAVKFMKMAAVSDETRRRFGRMGISQEQLLDSQAKYVEMQSSSGQSLNNQSKSTKKMQQESLDYAENLTRMSSLTGKKADQLQADRAATMAEFEEQAQIAAENKKIEELRARKGDAGAQAEADRIQAEQKKRQEFLQTISDTEGKERAAMMGKIYRTGSYNKDTAGLANQGALETINAYKASNGSKEAQIAAAKKMDDAAKENISKYNTAYQQGGEALGKQLGIGQEYITNLNKRGGADLTKTKAQIDKDMAAKAAAGTDPLADSIEGIRSMERESKAKFQTFLESIDPLRGSMQALKFAAIAAAAVLGSLALGKLASKIPGIGGLFGGGGASAGAAGAAGAVASGAGAAAGAAGGADAGIQTLNKAASGGGGAVGGFLKGIVEGLAAAGKPPVPGYIVLGAGAIGAAITALGAGLAGATWVMGKAMPSLANGLKAFDKLNGPNLQKVGFGMAGLGAGILAMGAGNVVGAIGNVVNFLVGGEDPIQKVSKQVLELQSFNFDKTKVKNNSEAMVAFSKAMAAASGIGAAGAVAQAGGAIAGGVAKFFGGKPPLQQFVDFSKLKIDEKQTRINAQAFVEFSTAMSSYKGYGSGIGALTATLGDAAAKFFGVKPPVDQFAYFSRLPIDEKKAAANSKSFVAFANAMAEYRGGPGLADTISALAGAGLSQIFGGDGPIEAFAKFAKMDFGPKAKGNADAFFKYAQSANMLSNGGGAAPGGGGTPASGGRSGAPSEGGGWMGGGSFASSVQSGMQAGASFGAGAVGAVGGAVGAVGSAIGSAALAVYDAIKIRSLLNFTGASGSYDNFQALNPGMKLAVLNAAADYKKETGNKLQVNSARRNLADQQRIWDTSVRAGTPGRQPNGRLVAKPNPNAPHIKGNAIDLQQGINDTARTNRILARHKLVNKYGAKDLPHYDLQAEYGGIFDGPDIGFPSDSNRGKKLGSLGVDSLLMKLAKTGSDSFNKTAVSTSSPTDNHAAEDQGAMNLELYNMIQHKLDNVLNALDSSHSTQSKILKHSMV